MSRKDETLRVFVRVRPPIYKEVKHETAVMVQGNSSVSVYYDNKETINGYDYVFNETAGQDDVFERVKPLLVDVLSGINSCIFAYGQTSSGKSHTMIGPHGGKDVMRMSPETWGILPRASEYLLGYLNDKARDGVLTYSVKASFLQIYNENLYDLLRDSGSMFDDRMIMTAQIGGNRGDSGRQDKEQGDLRIREVRKPKSQQMASGGAGEVYVSGLSEFRVETSEDILNILALGTNNRMTRSTDYNVTSSRSHAILQLTFEIETQVDSGQTLISRSKLNLIDLAGSEKMSTSEDSMMMLANSVTSNKHVKELTSINKSLHALGNVIAALSSTSRSHVPYRDSKLTRLLQDSLGGNTKTILIACVAPTVLHTVETLSTLSFADRAKHVKLQAVRANTVIDDKLTLAKAQAEIARLKALLSHALKQLEEEKRERRPSLATMSLLDGSSITPDMEELLNDNEALRRENEALRRGQKVARSKENSALDYLAPSPRYHNSAQKAHSSAASVSSIDSQRSTNNKNNRRKSAEDSPAIVKGFMSGVERFSYGKTPHSDEFREREPTVAATPNRRAAAKKSKRGSGGGSAVDDSDVSDNDHGPKGRGRHQIGRAQKDAVPSRSASNNNRTPSKPHAAAHTPDSVERNHQYQPQHDGVFFAIQQRQRLELNQLLAEANAKLQQQILGAQQASTSSQPVLVPTNLMINPVSSSSTIGSGNSDIYAPYQGTTGQQQPSARKQQQSQQQQQQQQHYPPSSGRNNPASSARTSQQVPDSQRSSQQTPAGLPDINNNGGNNTTRSAADMMLLSMAGGEASLPSNRVFRKKNNNATVNNSNSNNGGSTPVSNNSNINASSGSGHHSSNHQSLPALQPLVLQQQQQQQGQRHSSSLQAVVRSTASLMSLQQDTQIKQQQQQLQPPQDNNNSSNNGHRPAHLTQTADDIGRALEMFSFRLNAWERIDIIDFDASKRMYKVHYPTGAVQWLDLAKKPVRALADEMPLAH